MILKQILDQKRRELDRRWPDRDIAVEDVTPSDRSLEAALRSPATGYILECKKASPSRGLLRQNFDPVDIATAYEPFADAISVLTDETWFQGRLEYLTAVRDAVAVPVLCKDFVLEPFQVIQARKWGADAVLLMMSVLSDELFVSCFETAEKLRMDALVEVHSELELQRALHLGARIIGINNRDFSDLSIDLATTERLAPMVPERCICVSESGIRDHRDVRRLRPLVDGFLVGSALMTRPDLTKACAELIFGRVKVCGLTDRFEAQQVATTGVAFGGLIFARSSPRYVDMESAGDIVQNVPLRWVGVFVNEAPERVAEVVSRLHLHVVQLHGEESADEVTALRRLLPEPVEIWKAVSITDQLPDTSAFRGCRILYDGRSGGSGIPFDWSLLDAKDMGEAILAGGICRENAFEADGLDSYALDVNSGVESSPGHKDMDKLSALLSQLRGVGRIRL